jgi:DNA-binding NarL/FixJ family response regulator
MSHSWLVTASSTRQRIALIDDHALYREGLRAVLLSERTMVVVDVRLPDQPGASLTRELRRLQPQCKVLALSMVETPYFVTEMLRAGAMGYAIKAQPTEEIVEAIRTVARGGRYLASLLPRAQIEALVNGGAVGPLDMLSPREREVFDLLIRGWSSERVATALSIATRTAETHRQNIMSKLGVHSIVELIRIAARHGLLDEHDG